jgi:hypothetical protein
MNSGRADGVGDRGQKTGNGSVRTSHANAEACQDDQPRAHPSMAFPRLQPLRYFL